MYDIRQIVSHCARVLRTNFYLCDYCRQSAVIAGLAMIKTGQNTLYTTTHGREEDLKVSLGMGTIGFHQGFPGRRFFMEIEGPCQNLEVDFLINEQSVHDVLRLEADIALMLKDFFLPRSFLLQIESLHAIGIPEDVAAHLKNPETMQCLITMLRAQEMARRVIIIGA